MRKGQWRGRGGGGGWETDRSGEEGTGVGCEGSGGAGCGEDVAHKEGESGDEQSSEEDGSHVFVIWD